MGRIDRHINVQSRNYQKLQTKYGSGSPIGVVRPDSIEQIYIDEDTNAVYIAKRRSKDGWILTNDLLLLQYVKVDGRPAEEQKIYAPGGITGRHSLDDRNFFELRGLDYSGGFFKLHDAAGDPQVLLHGQGYLQTKNLYINKIYENDSGNGIIFNNDVNLNGNRLIFKNGSCSMENHPSIDVVKFYGGLFILNTAGTVNMMNLDNLGIRMFGKNIYDIDEVKATSYQPRVNGNDVIIENGAGTELARITDDGNVGIGTDNPAYKLDVQDIENGTTAIFGKILPISLSTRISRYAVLGYNLIWNGINNYIYGRGSSNSYGAMWYFDTDDASLHLYQTPSSGNAGNVATVQENFSITKDGVHNLFNSSATDGVITKTITSSGFITGTYTEILDKAGEFETTNGITTISEDGDYVIMVYVNTNDHANLYEIAVSLNGSSSSYVLRQDIDSVHTQVFSKCHLSSGDNLRLYAFINTSVEGDFRYSVTKVQ